VTEENLHPQGFFIVDFLRRFYRTIIWLDDYPILCNTKKKMTNTEF